MILETILTWAVVTLSSSFMRSAPDYESSLENQMLMGALVETLDTDRYWVKVKAEDYTGWVTDLGLKYLSDAEKEIKSKRRQIQEKLMKCATRIPIFMYLTDYREYSLKDVILQLEPKLFERVTGLTKQDFALLVSLNVFNESLMNDAVYKFKRYEDSSLSYAGIDRHEGEQKVGGYSTVISVEEYQKA